MKRGSKITEESEEASEGRGERRDREPKCISVT